MSQMMSLFGIDDVRFLGTEELVEDDKEYRLYRFEYDGELPDSCPKCGGKAYRHGTRKINLIATPIQGIPAQYEIVFPRLRCRTCGCTFSPEIKGTADGRRCTDNAFNAIAQSSLTRQFEDVARDYPATPNTIKNIFLDFFNEYEELLRFRTPAFLGLDEINLGKKGMVTVVTDIEHGTLFDILPQRNQIALTEYFSQLDEPERVLWVCTDMYRPFKKSLASCFPNAQWVIDHFHVVAYANRALDDLRKKYQATLTDKQRIHVKKGLAYVLKTREKDLKSEDADILRMIRRANPQHPLIVAFDLKEDFFNIWDDNPTSKENAIKAFDEWEASIPNDPWFDTFRVLAKTVHNFHTEIFRAWDCPTVITNAFTDATNGLIRHQDSGGRGYSFDILRLKMLYRRTNLKRIIESGAIKTGFYGTPVDKVSTSSIDPDEITSDDYF